ncbi:MAG: branched-chain amino acid ABC transporter substrate-binding protein [Coriobacteriia bacterium]|nr:branched-chain amino acid ABC transporter substrate-binding protein [Coriobacteriia bacterium]
MAKAKKYLAIVALLAAVALVVTGCGGSTPAPTEGAAKAVTVKIGIGAPITQGAVALGKGMERGAKLAIKDMNASEEAKKLGITFASVTGDDQGDPKTGVTVANQFASDPELVGVMGHLNSGVSIPGSKVYNGANLVQISPASTNPALTQQGFKNVFRVCTIDSVQGPAGADDAVAKLGKKAVFVVDDSTPYGEGLAEEFAKEFEAKGGKVVGKEKTGDKDTDFKALVTKIKSKGADIVYYGGIYNAGALLSKQLKEAGVKAPLMGGDGLYDGEYIKLAGAANAEGDLCTSVGLPLDLLPEGAKFKAAYKAEYPNDEIAAYDAYAYDAATVIMKATLEAAGKVGADKVTSTEGKVAIIAATAAFKGTGITGEIAFDANGDTTNKAITLYVVKGGAWAPFK